MNSIKNTSRLGKLAITPPYYRNQPTKGLVWFLHGTCDSGPGMQKWVKELLHRDFSFYKQQVLYPTAPSIPYALLNNQESNVWFNRLQLSPDSPEDLCSIESTASSLENLILEQTERKGIPLSKVVLGGFSQGGSMALHLAYRLHPQVAGCFALSSFLPPDSRIYDSLSEKMREQCKGREEDPHPTPGTINKNESTLESQSHVSPHTRIPLSSSDSEQNPQPLTTNTRESPTTPPPSIPTATSSPGYNHEGADDNPKTRLPQLFMSHGTHDPLVLHEWGKATFSKLRDHGVEGQFYTIPTMDHTINPVQLQLLHTWIDKVLEDKPKPKKGVHGSKWKGGQ